MSLNRKMSDKHEKDLAEWFQGRMTPGSGNQFNNQTDVRQSRYEVEVAFAIDGKSTMAKSVSITRETLDKLVEQAHGERPLLAVRFYDNERLTSYEDWSMIRTDDLLELLEGQ